MLTFGHVKASSALNIASVPASSEEFRLLLNEATERLMRRGDWEGALVPIHVCVQRGCVVWPRYVGQIRKMNVCNRGAPIQNVWFDFLPYSHQHGWLYNWSNNYWSNWVSGRAQVVNQTRSPVFQDVQGDDRTLRVYSSTPLDNNKKITFFGEDNNGQRLMTQGVGGWSDGITLTLNATSYAESKDATGTALKVRRIERVVKEVTQGPVRVYAWNTVTSVLEDVAFYEPSETEPSYLRTQLHQACWSSSCSTVTVVALVKLRFIPVRGDNDWVLIDNLAALKSMMQSIRSEDAGDLGAKAQFEAAAIRELNLGLSDANPDDQIPIDMGAMGRNDSLIGNQKLF
jgi:hypothetical protein